jgi:hypothetical protein
VYDFDWSSVSAGNIVYIHGSAIADFRQRILPLIHVPIVLVSGDSDEAMPVDVFPNEMEFRKFIEHPCIWSWFAQNLVLNHPKCANLPIGLDYHSLTRPGWHRWGEPAPPLEQERLLSAVAQQAPAWSDRAPLAYCNFQFQMWTRFAGDRKDALARMYPSALHVETAPTRRDVAWRTQATCAFVASPHGGGLDCHRTWEALALGCIPIVRRSVLDPMYWGLPVLIIDDWSQVTPERLSAVHANPPDRGNMEKIKLAYWTGLIRASQQACLHPRPG